MFSTFRVFVLGSLMLLASTAYGQKAPPAAVPPQLGSGSSIEDASQVKVFPVRNASAAEIQKTLGKLLGDDVELAIAAQQRTNQLVVIGKPSALDRVEALLAVLDQSSAEPAIEVLSNLRKATTSKGLVQTLAHAAQVEVTSDEELGVMMVRGESPDSVKRFTDILERINTKILEDSRVVEREVLVRVSWLSPNQGSDGSNSVAPDASLKEAIARLTSMGYTDLKVAGQLMARCSTSSTATGSTPEFKAEGFTPGGFRFGARGYFVSRDGSADGAIDVDVSVNVNHPSSPENNGDSLLSVVLKMKEGKPIILGSAPVAGAQSFFVVQFIVAD